MHQRSARRLLTGWGRSPEHKAMRNTARDMLKAADWARHRNRMVRQTVTTAPTPRAAGSATYRLVFDPPKAASPRPAVLAPVRAVKAAGWAAGAWVAASGYTAWSRHWQAQQRLALTAADPIRGYVVASRVRSNPPVVLVRLVPVPVPVPRPVLPPRWRTRVVPGTGPTGNDVTGRNTPTPVGSSSSTSVITGGVTMSRFHISDLAAEQAARATRYAPESMAYFGGDLQQWPEAIGHLALALSTFVKKGSAEYPVHPMVMEKLAEVYRALGTAAAAASEVPALFSRAHSIDLARHQAPRPGEHLWNVGR